MDKDEKKLYDLFLDTYVEAVREYKCDNYDIAKTKFALSSKLMFDLAKSSVSNDVKNNRKIKAEKILDIAKNCNSKTVNIDDVFIDDIKPIETDEPKKDEIFSKANKYIKKITFDDVIGLDNVKDVIKTKVILKDKYPEYYKALNKKTGGGLLLYGPPGTGKTMIAKAIASEVGADFYSIRCSDLLSKFFGESEQKIKSLFDEARKSKKAIIFFDEIEAIATKRSDDNSAMNRVVPELLSQIDGFGTDDQNILIIGATNLPWNLDEAMMRPPRFNDILYVPLPSKQARSKLFETKLKNVYKDEILDYSSFSALTQGFSGADIEEVCEKAKNFPLMRSIDMLKLNGVTNSDMIKSIRLSSPSVTTNFLSKYDRYRKNHSKNDISESIGNKIIN